MCVCECGVSVWRGAYGLSLGSQVAEESSRAGAYWGCREDCLFEEVLGLDGESRGVCVCLGEYKKLGGSYLFRDVLELKLSMSVCLR